MKDNDSLDWVNDNEVTVFIKSVRNNASKGRVGLNEVMEVEKGIIIRELAFCLSEGFDNRVVGPEYSPWQRARVVSSGGDNMHIGGRSIPKERKEAHGGRCHGRRRNTRFAPVERHQTAALATT